MPFLYGYCRVSHHDQWETGVSIPAQKESIQRCYLRHGDLKQKYQFGGIFVEEGGTSAYKKPLLDRKVGSALDKRLRRGDMLVVTKMDRVFRSPKDGVIMLDRWQNRGVNLYMMDFGIDTSTVSGQAMANLIAVISGWFSSMTSIAIKTATNELRRYGIPTSGDPLGYKRHTMKVDKDFPFPKYVQRGKAPFLMPYMAERRQMRLIRALNRNGHDYFCVARWLKDNDIKRPPRKSFQKKKVDDYWTYRGLNQISQRELQIQKKELESLKFEGGDTKLYHPWEVAAAPIWDEERRKGELIDQIVANLHPRKFYKTDIGKVPWKEISNQKWTPLHRRPFDDCIREYLNRDSV